MIFEIFSHEYPRGLAGIFLLHWRQRATRNASHRISPEKLFGLAERLNCSGRTITCHSQYLQPPGVPWRENQFPDLGGKVG